jgi:hypothetical protein
MFDLLFVYAEILYGFAYFLIFDYVGHFRHLSLELSDRLGILSLSFCSIPEKALENIELSFFSGDKFKNFLELKLIFSFFCHIK